MKFQMHMDFWNSYATLSGKSGSHKRAAEKFLNEFKRLKTCVDPRYKPFSNLPRRNETRIDHCWKFQLSKSCRLINICNNGLFVLCFIGTHDDCDKWLEKNKGLRFTVDDEGKLIEMTTSSPTRKISTESDMLNKPLYKRISMKSFDKIPIPYSVLKNFEGLTAFSTDDEIIKCAELIYDKDMLNLYLDVFLKLREGDKDGAENRIDLYLRTLTPVENLAPKDVMKIKSGDTTIELKNIDEETLKDLILNTSFQKWMLFMHPDQRDIVDKDFKGPAKVVGVSGSGKTCIIINRAIRLAKKYNTEKVLILTLNRSLAKLIQNLMDIACPISLRKNIEIKSFWEYCQSKLFQYEPDHKKLYSDVTWKTNEDVNEIWNEFYECKENNDDAQVLDPVNKTLLIQRVFPKDYLKQEFDWIRSSFPLNEREKYYTIKRKGRVIRFNQNLRKRIIEGLSYWEEKMKFVGIVDYLGLSNALYKHINKITPEYKCILIDEVQDFGTIELEIIRKLVEEGDNDLFITGDEAQKINSKHFDLQISGIDTIGRSFKIKKNYRNGRQILEAAYGVLITNLTEDNIAHFDFEVLEPDYANFSTSMPLILKAENIEQEFDSCLSYINDNLNSKMKSCIVFCGYSAPDVKRIGDISNIPVLDGTVVLDDSNIFLSDLEQTKGFEFDTVFIINCNKNIIPSPILPESESYREISKIYVAMTRAKLELIISYNEEPSLLFKNCMSWFNSDNWINHVDDLPQMSSKLPLPKSDESDYDYQSMTGNEFLFTLKAVGIKEELYDKIMNKITGYDRKMNNKQVEWQTVGHVLDDIRRDMPNVSHHFGRNTVFEFESIFGATTLLEIMSNKEYSLNELVHFRLAKNTQPKSIKIQDYKIFVKDWTDLNIAFVNWLSKNQFIKLSDLPIENYAERGKYYLNTEQVHKIPWYDGAWKKVGKIYVDTKYNADSHKKNLLYTLKRLNVENIKVIITFQ